jgi:hypothetical protein
MISVNDKLQVVKFDDVEDRRLFATTILVEGNPMTRRSSLRSQLYRAARDLGNVEAASKGPGSYGKRVARRKVYRTTNGLTNQLLRSAGLMGKRR